MNKIDLNQELSAFVIAYETYEGNTLILKDQDEFVSDMGKVFNRIIGDYEEASKADFCEGVKQIGLLFNMINCSLPHGCYISHGVFSHIYNQQISPIKDLIWIRKMR